MRVLLAVSVVVAMCLPSFGQNNVIPDPPEGTTTVEPMFEGYPDGSAFTGPVPLDGQVFFPAVVGAPTSRIKYSRVGCEASWNTTCDASFTLEAPAGKQACRAIFSIASQVGSTIFEVRPSRWYTNDRESPDRFRAYDFVVYAIGAGDFWDRRGSSLILSNVGMVYLAADATNDDRYKWGCDMPRHD